MADENVAAAQRILITGITGYIGFQTLTIALERGLQIRGVVRTQANIKVLKSKSEAIAQAHDNGQLEFVVVPDFVKDGAIQSTLTGITTIIHLASPLAIQTEDFEEGIIKPAVSMVTVVQEAASKAPTVKRVVITSSCVTLVPFEWNMNPDSERLYTVADVNINPKRPFESPMEAYRASKGLARTAASEFITQHQHHFDFVNLLPSVVIGADTRIPPDGTTADLLQGARASVLASALDGSLNSSFPFVGVPVHVADVAKAHVDAIDRSRVPGNTEFILSSDIPEGVEWDRDIHAIARKYFPDKVQDGTLPLKGSLASITWLLDASPTEKAFGWDFISFEEAMRGWLAQYLELSSNKSSEGSS